jgi:hypothetical protein
MIWPLRRRPRLVECDTCRAVYDVRDPKAVRWHTAPAWCAGCRRCPGRPRCYLCTGEGCLCTEH